MGTPQKPTSEQIKQLETAGQLQQLAKPKKMAVQNGIVEVCFSLPRQGVSLLKLDW
jgi:xylan 1,4-beta-xylosidase